VAKSGYVNLLQPQDRRSRLPGDSKKAVTARRRFLDAGHEKVFLDRLLTLLDGLDLSRPAAVLDVGCGEGTYAAAVALRLGAEVCGVDISAAAIDAAARRYPGPLWIVANADRRLPFAAEGFDLVLAITAHRNRDELARILKPTGALVVAVPGPDDLIELRQAVLGEGRELERSAPAVAALAPAFDLVQAVEVRWTAELDAAAIRDVLAATYRAGRISRQERIAALAEQSVTLQRTLMVFRKEGPGGNVP
jgi:23S rRNA (guanine745-N1)-methyltransferase